MSVVIPTYNTGPLVVEAVESVLAQTRPADEIIVVDDGSTDDTAERIAPFQSIVRYVRKENGGASSARNRGLDEATGDWVAFLDADDVWHPRKLEIQLAALTRRPKLGMLATQFYIWPGEVPEVPPDAVEAADDFVLDEMIIHNVLGTSSVVARTEVLRAAGPFDLELRGPEDRDMWIRIALRTQVARLRAKLTGYRYTPGSLSSNAGRMEAGMSRILRKLEAAGVFRERPVLRRKAWAIFRFSSGLTYRDAGQLGVAANRFARSLVAWPFRVSDRLQDSGGIHRFQALVRTLWQLIATGKQGIRPEQLGPRFQAETPSPASSDTR